MGMWVQPVAARECAEGLRVSGLLGPSSPAHVQLLPSLCCHGDACASPS